MKACGLNNDMVIYRKRMERKDTLACDKDEDQ